MILFTLLAIVMAIMAIVLLFSLVAGGAAFIVVFGDVIVFVGLIVLLVKLFRRKK